MAEAIHAGAAPGLARLHGEALRALSILRT